MSIQVNNTDNQLNIITNGVLDVYNVKTIKSVSRAVDASGNHYIALNFIANDKNNSVRIPLNLVTSPVGWTNDTAGATAAVEDIRDWLAEIVEVDIDAANDSIGIYGYNGSTPTPVFVNANGQVAIQGLYGEDSAHVSTNSGMFVMGVRNDSNTVMTNANGDYSPIAVNSKGAVAIHDGGGEISVDGAVELQFNDGLGPVNVNTTNPLPVSASVTFPASLPVTQDPLSNPWIVDGRVSIGDGADLLEINTDGSLNTQSNTYDGAGNAITSTTTGPTVTALDVNVIPSPTNVLLDSLVETTDGDLSLFGQNITSITFQSIGTAAAKVSVNGGSTFFDLTPGTVINLAPGITSGYYQGSLFFWDLTTNPGSSLLIIYSYI